MTPNNSLDWDLLKDLECPVCLEYMASPIRMCENGHNVCNSCRPRVSACPTCRGQFISARNNTLENIAANAIYPCKNRAAGCEQTLSSSDSTKHLSECLYQSTVCPFTKLSHVNCPWSGNLREIGDHVRSEHSREISEYTVWSEYTGWREYTGCFEVILQNFHTARRYRKAIYIWDKLFYLVWEVWFDTFYFAVFHIGHKKEAENFIYEFKMCKCLENISVTGICRSYLEENWKVLRPGECVALHYRTAQKYVNQNEDLLCEIKVRKSSCSEVNVAARPHYVAVAKEIN